MFAEYEARAIRYGHLPYIMASGALSGLALTLIPPLLLALNAAVFRGSAHLIVDYYVKGWPVLTVFCALTALQALLNWVCMRKRWSFTTVAPAPGGGFSQAEVIVGLDAFVPTLLVPIAMSIWWPDVAKVLWLAMGAELFSGLLLYVAWAWPYGRLVEHFGNADKLTLLRLSLREEMNDNARLSRAAVTAAFHSDARLVVFEGTVPDRAMLAELRLTAMRIRGVEDADTSGVTVEPRTASKEPGSIRFAPLDR